MSKRELESLIYDMRCIGRTLVILTEGAGDYAEVFSFLGDKLIGTAENARDAFNALLYPDEETPGMPIETARAAE